MRVAFVCCCLLYSRQAQFGNTCYFNSVLQALYYCVQFRQAVLAHVPKSPADNNLLLSLKELFATVSTSTRRSGAFAPKKFYSRLKTDNGKHITASIDCQLTRCCVGTELFNSAMQQDAQEFLNFLLNHIAELLQPRSWINVLVYSTSALLAGKASNEASAKSFVHEIFEGVLTNETKCMCCETVRTGCSVCVCLLPINQGHYTR